MNTLVQTATGSVYEFTPDMEAVRRTKVTHDLRGDHTWLRLLRTPNVSVGASMTLVMEPLGDGDCTIRSTSKVTKIMEPA